MSEYLTTEDVADLLRCSRQAVYDRLRRHPIPHYRSGKRLLFTRNDVMAWLQPRGVTPNSE